MLLQQSSHIQRSLRAIAKAGVATALDDFGTGYSSLSYLKRFPIDIVKIDQSFVRDITTDAEGVETVEQLNFLQEQGCHLIQGYHFSKPLKTEDIAMFLKPLNGMHNTAVLNQPE